MVSFNYCDNVSLFHSITQLHLSKEQLDSILRTCGGHPLTLDFVSRVATQDLSLTTDVNKTPSGADYDDVISLLTDKLFTDTFSRLSQLEQHVLLAVGLFERDVSLEVLYKVSAVVSSPNILLKKLVHRK